MTDLYRLYTLHQCMVTALEQANTDPGLFNTMNAKIKMAGYFESLEDLVPNYQGGDNLDRRSYA